MTITREEVATMADIKRAWIFRHLRAEPTSHIRHLRHGRPVHEGAGLAFWFRPLVSAISEIPVDERELPLVFHARTADFQDVVVQATITYRVTDPARAAERIDFSIDPADGIWHSTPLEQLGGLLTELAQQYAVSVLARTSLRDSLVEGLPIVRDEVAAGLRADERLIEIGLEVAGVRVVAIRPEAELERALQMPVREQLQQDADKATFERRALAVERERAISENELQSQIELAKREEQLVAQRGQNQRRDAEEQAAALRIRAGSQADEAETLARGTSQATRLIGEAEGQAEAARLEAYRDLKEATLMGLALKELAQNLPNIETLVLTPDVITSALTRMATGNATGGVDR
jgi:regulator of protease activity HflC (stomatin/prohibitin superfamily)